MFMSSKYDEDVSENPFFMKLMSSYAELIEKVTVAEGIVCVPKISIASHTTVTREDAEDHILLPFTEGSEDGANEVFKTLSGKLVHVDKDKLTTKSGFQIPAEISVLFAETFHGDVNGSYRVFCIDGLINREVEKDKVQSSLKNVSPTSYVQVLDMLWSHSGGQKMRESLDKILNTFAATYDRLEGESLRSIVDAANAHFAKAMQLLLKDSVVGKSARYNHHYMENLKVAVETYMMNAVHKHLFPVIIATVASQDAELNKITRNLRDLQLSDLGIRKIFNENILPAKKELSQLNRYSTPVGRLFCIKRVVAALTKAPRLSSVSRDGTAMMTSDDLLPILIFLIIKSEVPNWMANLVYMQHFHFAKSSDDDEFGFYLASIEAALEHIKTGNIKEDIKPLKRDRWNTVILTESMETPNTPPSPASSASTQSYNSIIDEFFKYVQEGDERAVIQMLEQPQKSSEEITMKMCHPLCSCDRCDKLVSELRTNSKLVTAYTRDNKGYTALHIAAYYGQGLLIDLLVKNHAVVDATDYLGLTPLHLACQRGYQNVMLLLLHFGADITVTDNEGNTPLHLSCANGHEDCVKALVFYDAYTKKLNINATNELGNTPLHLAAKWGYDNIVKTLLENGAGANIRNKKQQTPVSLAQNVVVQRWLQVAAEGLDFHPISPHFVSPKSGARSRSSSIASAGSLSNSHSDSHSKEVEAFNQEAACFSTVSVSLEDPSEAERRRKKERLFKAIIEGDIQLVKFYFGLQSDSGDIDDDDDLPGSAVVTSSSGMCHPLCQCDKCAAVQKATRKSSDKMSVDVKTNTGYSPIHMAVLHNHSDIVELLILLKANVSLQNHKGMTPLHLACCVRSSLITDMLVKAGAKTDVKDMNSDTALIIAASNGFLNGVQILIKGGADLNMTNMKGNTALHEALRRKHFQTANCLLAAGADPRMKNSQGKLPLDETNDPVMRGLVVAASFRLEEETKAQQNTNANKQILTDFKPENGHISIKELFAAFEEKDLHTLQSLAASIRTFDRKSKLRKTVTHDHSLPRLDGLVRKHSILSFNKNTLRKVRSVDKADPLHVYSLFKSKSMDHVVGNSNNNNDELLTPMGDNSLLPIFDYSEDRSYLNLPSSDSLENESSVTDDQIQKKSAVTEMPDSPSCCS
ncbi:ankyrin repeat domain-containing protein 27 [Biomphalaria glabrata]|nr:ankyrin repeat domain-containing protein 27 [Biomphalaria glabrata]